MSCGNWAKAGHCTSNPVFMLKACPTSCGLCTPTCKDVHDDCAGWTAAGACGDNVRGEALDRTTAERSPCSTLLSLAAATLSRSHSSHPLPPLTLSLLSLAGRAIEPHAGRPSSC